MFGDGNLLYEKTDLVGATKPITMQVDVTGVTDLKIEIEQEGYNPTFVLCSNMILQKTH